LTGFYDNRKGEFLCQALNTSRQVLTTLRAVIVKAVLCLLTKKPKILDVSYDICQVQREVYFLYLFFALYMYASETFFEYFVITLSSTVTTATTDSVNNLAKSNNFNSTEKKIK
jgi:hypothetical protein